MRCRSEYNKGSCSRGTNDDSLLVIAGRPLRIHRRKHEGSSCVKTIRNSGLSNRCRTPGRWREAEMVMCDAASVVTSSMTTRSNAARWRTRHRRSCTGTRTLTIIVSAAIRPPWQSVEWPVSARRAGNSASRITRPEGLRPHKACHTSPDRPAADSHLLTYFLKNKLDVHAMNNINQIAVGLKL